MRIQDSEKEKEKTVFRNVEFNLEKIEKKSSEKFSIHKKYFENPIQDFEFTIKIENAKINLLKGVTGKVR